VAELVAFTGQSFADSWDRTTWADYLAINELWRTFPPASISLARLAGTQAKADDTAGDETDEALQAANVAMLSELAGRPPPQG
jgi:hypothetical protein